MQRNENLIKSAGSGTKHVVVDLQGELGLDVLVEEAKGKDGEGGVAKIVYGDESFVQSCLKMRKMWRKKNDFVDTICC